MELMRIVAALDALDDVPLSKLTVRDVRYICEARATYHTLWHEESVHLAEQLEAMCRTLEVTGLLQSANAVNSQSVADSRGERKHKNKQ